MIRREFRRKRFLRSLTKPVSKLNHWKRNNEEDNGKRCGVFVVLAAWHDGRRGRESLKRGHVQERCECVPSAVAMPGCLADWMRESRQTNSSGTGTEPWCE